MSEQLLESVKSKYGAVAESTLSSDHAGVKAVAEAFGYSAEETDVDPRQKPTWGLSCGNPTATAHPSSRRSCRGPGIRWRVGTCFLAAKMVGPEGSRHWHRHDDCHDRTREGETRLKAAIANVEFYQSTIDPDSLA